MGSTNQASPTDRPSTPTALSDRNVPESTQPSSPNSPKSHEISKGCTTPNSAWDSQSQRVLTDPNNPESPGGSRTYLLSRYPAKSQSIIGTTSGTSTPGADSISPKKSLGGDGIEGRRAEPPFHVFSHKKKKFLMYVAAIAGMFSSLSANIYFPALAQISKEIHVSMSLLSLTVTVYMIVQGLAPSFWGPLSDARGRRITFIGTFVVYLAANIGLAFSNSLGSLMALRGLQAAGSAATISIGQGLISDIATPKERGSFTGTNQGIRVFGQAIGPVFGGLITQYLGYHAIFWVLFGAGAFALLALIIILPETLRSIAGNGSIRLKGINRPLYYKFTPPPEELVEHDLPPKQKLSFSMVFTPFRLLLEKDVFSIIFFGSVVYAVWSMVTSSTSALFQTRFHLNELELGLVFLPNGTASMLGAYLTGKLSKHDWVVMERRYRADKKIPDNVTLKKKELVDFPFEKTRMRNMWWMVLLFLISTALYGFSLLLDIIALPLILQFIISYTANSIFALNSTLVVDLYPGKSASATAVNNLVRCLLGALGVAVVQMIIDGVGAGPTFALFSGITLAATPLLLLEWRNGGRWAQDRRNRIATREKKAREENVEAVTVVQDVVAAKA